MGGDFNCVCEGEHLWVEIPTKGWTEPAKHFIVGFNLKNAWKGLFQPRGHLVWKGSEHQDQLCVLYFKIFRNIFSDHMFLSVSLQLMGEDKSNRSQWQLNTSLLEDYLMRVCADLPTDLCCADIEH